MTYIHIAISGLYASCPCGSRGSLLGGWVPTSIFAISQPMTIAALCDIHYQYDMYSTSYCHTCMHACGLEH